MRKLKFLFLLLVCISLNLAAQTYYNGSGGSDTSISVSQPVGTNLVEGDEWILDFIRRVLISDFRTFSAITVVDQAETNRTGFLLLSGRLVRDGIRYRIELSIAEVARGTRRASYLKTDLKASEILNASALNIAFEDLLGQLGVTLTPEGKKRLANPSPDELDAALNLARGVQALNPIEMLNYYFNALSYDPSLDSTALGLDALAGELAEDLAGVVKNDKAARDRWKTILDEFEQFYVNHPPFELSYIPAPTQLGITDYDRGTAVLQFEMNFQEGVGFDSMRKVLRTLLDALGDTKNQRQWGFANWPYRSVLRKSRNYAIVAELVNNRGEVLDQVNIGVFGRLYFSRGHIYGDSSSTVSAAFRAADIEKELTENMIVRVVSIDGVEIEEAHRRGFVKITPTEKLPGKKIRNPLFLLTRDFFAIH